MLPKLWLISKRQFKCVSVGRHRNYEIKQVVQFLCGIIEGVYLYVPVFPQFFCVAGIFLCTKSIFWSFLCEEYFLFYVAVKNFYFSL